MLTSPVRARYWLFGLWGVAVAAASFSSCKESAPGGEGGGGGGGGQGGCPSEVTAQFTVTLRAKEGALPADTEIRVTWSAGEEPVFALDDPESYKTLEDGSNLVCDVDPNNPAPTDLEELVCHLWTSGPTRVEVAALGYVPLDETLVPEFIEGCDVPIPTNAEIELDVDMDAGVE